MHVRPQHACSHLIVRACQHTAFKSGQSPNENVVLGRSVHAARASGTLPLTARVKLEKQRTRHGSSGLLPMAQSKVGV